jgi:prevent-host-death family protein
MLVSASEFKAKCLALLERVRTTGEEIVITKRGVPIATLVAPRPAGFKYPQDALAGSVEIVGDIVTPALPPDAWEAEAIGPVEEKSKPAPRRNHRRRGARS